MSEVARGRGGRGASSVGQSVDVRREHPCNGCHRSVVRRRDMHQQRKQPALGTIPLAEGGDFGVGRGDEGSGGSRRRRRRSGGGGLLAVAVVALAACCPTAFGFLVHAPGCERLCNAGAGDGAAGPHGASPPHCPPWGIKSGHLEGAAARAGGAGSWGLGRRNRRALVLRSSASPQGGGGAEAGGRGRTDVGPLGALPSTSSSSSSSSSSFRGVSQGTFQGTFQGSRPASSDRRGQRVGRTRHAIEARQRLESSRHGGGKKHGSPAEAGRGGGSSGDAGRDGRGGDASGDDGDATRGTSSPLRWMRRNLRAGWGGKGGGAAGVGGGRRWGFRSRDGGGGMGSRRRVARAAQEDGGQVSTLERPVEEEEDAVGREGAPQGAGRGEDGHHRQQTGLRGWGLSGWAADIEGRKMSGWMKTNREWKRFTGGLRQPWTARDHADKQLTWASLFKIDTSGMQEVLKTRGSDLAIKTLAKLQTMAGQEDQAEETLLKLIRDPYNLSDASWTPDSVAETAEWRRLEVHQKRVKHKHLKDVMAHEDRSLALSAEFEGTILDYSRMNVSPLTMKLLLDLAKRQSLKGKINAMFAGEKINNTEDRAVLHVALRSQRDDPPILVDGVNVIQQVHDTLDKVRDFSERVRSGELQGATGKNLTNIVAVGIGGSYLGPEFVHEAFKTQEYAGREKAEGYRLRFLSNVDPVDVRRTLYDLDPEETLVVVISKTFTTAETMLNARTARQWLWDTMGKEPEVAMKHMAACASESASERVTAFGIPADRLFPLWDWVGGRYSVCSSVGALPLSLKYGFQQFDSFLAGARSMDKHFLHAPFERNMPVLMGLLGVWNISFMGYKTRTILPYAEALLKFPAHIQQLAMESNGKRVTRNGQKVSYDIGQVDFGEPGTNGQHSFFQLLHMGQVCPAEFIGFIESQNPLHIKDEPICSHDELMANFFAQPDALAMGKPSEELRREGCRPDLIPHRTFDGNRPSLSLLVPKVNAYHLGEMLALYEHRTAVEGFMWDINSFDQWGVELGKSLATDIREKMERFRSPAQSAPCGLNPSTYRLMSRYLQQSETLIKKGGNINHRSKVIKRGLD